MKLFQSAEAMRATCHLSLTARLLRRTHVTFVALLGLVAAMMPHSASAQVTAPPALSFGSVTLGSSQTQTLTFSFSSSATVGSVSVVTQGATGLDFTTQTPDASTTLCQAQSYGSGSTCTVDVTFAPLQPGQRIGAVLLKDGVGNILATGYISGVGMGARIGFGTQTVSTVAGSGTSGYNFNASTNTSALSNNLGAIAGSAVDPHGNIYLADALDNVVWKVTPGGQISIFAGSFHNSCNTISNPTCGIAGPTTLATAVAITEPNGIAIDALGDVWFSDVGDDALYEVNPVTNFITRPTFDPTGKVYIPTGNLSSAFIATPWAIAFDGRGFMYLSSFFSSPGAGNSRQEILKVDSNGNITRVAGTTTSNGVYTGDGGPATSATLNEVGSIVVDGSGNLYLADFNNSQVYKVDTAGNIHLIAGTGNSLGADNTGTLPFLNSGQTSTTLATSLNLAQITGLAIDSAGTVYINNANSSAAVNRILAINSSNDAYILAGTGAAGESNGGLSTATFEVPFSLSSDSADNLYVGEFRTGSTGSNLRKISPSGGSSASLNFATTIVGSTSTDSPQSVTLLNTGNEALTLSTPSSGLNPFIPNGFLVDGASTCAAPSATPSQTLAAGASCTYSIDFKPVAGGIVNAALVSSGDLVGGSISLSGTGVLPVNHFTLTNLPTTVTAGTSFNGTVTAYFDSGTTLATNYTGPVAITSSDSAAVLPANITLANGVGNFAITLKTAGATHTVTAADVSGAPSVTSSNIAVTPASAASVTIVNGSSESAVIGSAFASALKVQVLDAFTNAVPGIAVNFSAPLTGASATLSGSPATTDSSGAASVTATANGIASPTAYSVAAAAAGVSSPTLFSLTNTQRATTVTVSSTGTSLAYGQPTTLNATISPTSVLASTPSGSVTFYDGPGTALTPNSTVSGAGASYLVSVPSVGSHTFFAKYLGDTNFLASAQTSAAGAVVVSKANSSLTGPASQPVHIADATTGNISINVTGQFPGSGVATPSGTISYTIGSGATQTASISSGVATITVPNSLPDNFYTVAVSYGGDTNYNAAPGININIQVGQITPTVSFTQPSAITYGTTLSSILSATATSSGAPVAGAFSYTATPAGGSPSTVTSSTVLTAATYILTANFTPTDTATYKGNSASVSLVVNQATPTLVWNTPAPISYGTVLSGTQLNATATGVTGSNLPGTFTYSPAANTTLNANTNQTLSVSFAPTDATDYTTVTKSVSIVVNTASQTITFTAPTTPVTYGISPISLSATSTSGLAVSFSVLSGPATINGSTLAITGAGTVVIAANQAGNTNYSAATQVTQTIIVNAAPQTITFTAPISPVTYGVSPITLSATSTSGLAVSFSVISGAGTVVGNTLAVTGAGTIVIAANQAGSTNYSAAAQVTQIIVVTAASQTITFTALTSPVTYGVSPITLSATSSSGLSVSFSVVSGPGVVVGNTLAVTGAGTIVIAANQAGSTNYSAAAQVTQATVVNAASQTITFAAPVSPVTFGVTPITLSATSSSGLPVSFSVVSGPGTVIGSTLTVTGAGTIVIAANQAGNTNYAAATQVTRSVVVNVASQTITFSAPISPVTYGVTPITLSATSSSGLSVSFSVVSGPGTVIGNTLTVTGAGAIVIAANQAGNANYSAAAQVTQTITVNTASQTIAFAALVSPVAYGVAPITLSATSTSGLAVSFSVVSGPGAITGNTLTVTGGGAIVIAANQAGNINYSAATQVTQTIIVNTASQTITFAALTSPVTYGVAPITLSAASTSGLVVSFSVISGPATVSGSILTITGAGTVVVAANQVGTTNYSSATQVTHTIVVNKATPVVSWTAPTPINYGTALSGTQLNAIVTGVGGTPLTGTTVYSPALGAILTAGTNTLELSFTPTDTTDYNTATGSVTLTVNETVPTLTWATPAAISYGVPLSATQLDASIVGAGGTPLAGSTIYTPAIGTYLTPGLQTLKAAFTPTDSTDYASQTGSVGLTVKKAIVTIAGPITQPVSVLYGQSGAIAVTVTGAYTGTGIAVPSGSASYTISDSSSTAVASGPLTLTTGTTTVPVPSTLAPGAYSLNVSYGGDNNYSATTSATTINLQVAQILPSISWKQPGAITYGTSLTGLLNATALSGSTTVAGNFVYTATLTGGTPSAITSATVLAGGTYTLTASFAPTNTTIYKAATSTVTLTVNSAAPLVTVASSVNPVLVKNAVTLTATVSSTVSTPSGTVSFVDGTTALGSGTLTGGVATFTTSTLAVGSHSITAIYSGDTNFAALTSSAVSESVQDFSLGVPTSGSTSQTISAGGTATYSLTISPIGSTTLPADVALSVSGLPTTVSYTLTPTTVVSGAGATAITLIIQVPAKTAQVAHGGDINKSLAPVALAMLLLPFSARMRRSAKRLGRVASVALLLLTGLGATVGLIGCSSNGAAANQAPTYTITVTGTSGALTHSTTVTLDVQ